MKGFNVQESQLYILLYVQKISLCRTRKRYVQNKKKELPINGRVSAGVEKNTGATTIQNGNRDAALHHNGA